MASLAWRSHLLSALLVCGTACAPTEDLKSGTAEIVGGASDDDHASVALIRFLVTDAAGESKGSNCTGTLVAPTIVLTAAHCVAPTSGKYSDWTVSFEATTKDGELVDPIKVARALPHPRFRASFGTFDVALLFLERAPTGRLPMPIVEALGDVTGEEVTFVGYGAVDASRDGSQLIGGNDRRRKVTARLSGVDDTFLSYEGRALCGGDSGGPTLMMINGVETIVGTNDLTGIGCNGHGASLRIDDMSTARSFLAANVPNVSEAKLPDPPDGDAGAPEPDLASTPEP